MLCPLLTNWVLAAVSSVHNIGFPEVSSVAKRATSAVSSIDQIGPSTLRTVLPSVGKSVRHVPSIPYVSDIVLVVVISFVKMDVPATTL